MPTDAPKKPARTRLMYHPVQPLSSWSVRAVRAALREHEEGNLTRSALLAEHMERNPRIFAALQTRVLGVLGLPFDVTPSEDGDQRKAKSVATATRRAWYELAPEDVVADLLRWAVLLGVAFAEIVWDTSSGPWRPRLVPVHPSLFSWSDTRGWEVQTSAGLVPVASGDGRWLVLGYTRSRPWMRGVVRCLGLEDKVRAETVRDWARWSERHGTPILLARTPSGASDIEKDRFFDDMSALGAGGTTVMTPQGATEQDSFDVELVEAKAAEASKGFGALLEFVATDASIAILGQNLTQETKGGSLAAAKVQDRVRVDYLEADAELLATSLRRDVLRPEAHFNHGDADLAAWPCWDASPPEDREKIAATRKAQGEAIAALRATKARLDWRALLGEFGLPVDPDAPKDEPPFDAADPVPAAPPTEQP